MINPRPETYVHIGDQVQSYHVTQALPMENYSQLSFRGHQITTDLEQLQREWNTCTLLVSLGTLIIKDVNTVLVRNPQVPIACTILSWFQTYMHVILNNCIVVHMMMNQSKNINNDIIFHNNIENFLLLWWAWMYCGWCYLVEQHWSFRTSLLKSGKCNQMATSVHHLWIWFPFNNCLLIIIFSMLYYIL